MRVALIHPSAPVREPRLDQRIAGLQVRFGEKVSVEHLSASEAADMAARSPNGLTLADFAAVVAFWEDIETTGLDGVTHRVSSQGRVLPLPGAPLSAIEDPQMQRHDFHEFAPRDKAEIEFGCFKFFPFGYTFQLLGYGPVDAFGHRIAGNFRSLRDRGRDEKLIVCFGGSAVWGTTVLPHQTFPAQLEQIIRNDPDIRQLGTSVNVLNFGIPGATVLNATQRYLLFAAELNPDVVIAHDGVNDFFYAQTSDAWLVREHSIVYQPTMVEWARLLSRITTHSDKGISGTVAKSEPPLLIEAVRAYLRRKREFVKLAQRMGARVVTGLQPVSFSKASLSSIEEERIRASWACPPNYEAELSLVSGAYSMLASEKPELGSCAHIDFHSDFKRYDASYTLFADKVHLDVDGETRIAEAYASVIRPLLTRLD